MNKKKLLALLMALVMTLSLIPTTVWADDEPALTGYFTYEGLDQNTPSDDQDLSNGEAVVISDGASSRNAYLKLHVTYNGEKPTTSIDYTFDGVSCFALTTGTTVNQSPSWLSDEYMLMISGPSGTVTVELKATIGGETFTLSTNTIYINTEPPAPAVPADPIEGYAADGVTPIGTYATLKDAIAAENVYYVKLTDDISASDIGLYTKDLTLDLNGQMVDATNAKDLFMSVSGGRTLTIKDSSEAGNGKLSGAGGEGGMFFVSEDAAVVLESGKIEYTSSDSSYAVFGCVGTQLGVSIIGGSITANCALADGYQSAISISGGKIDATGSEGWATNIGYGIAYSFSGGSFSSEMKVSTANKTIGGKAVAAGYKIVEEDGWYKVVSANVAQIVENGQMYPTLDEAIAAAQDGETVRLLQNIALDRTTKIEKSITIDGNHKSLTVTGGNDANKYALYVIDENEPVKKKLNVAIRDLTMTTTGYQVAVMLNGSFYSTLALNHVNITCDGECIYANGLTSATANDCNFTHEGTYATGKDFVYYSALIVGYGGNLEVSNCTVTSFGNGASTFPSGGSITLTNTDISINNDTASETNAGYAIWSRNEDYTNYPALCRDSVITFHSGKVSGDFKITDKYTTGDEKNVYDPKIVIDGGIFSVEPAAAYIAPGYKVIPNTDGTTQGTYPHTIGVDKTAFVDVENTAEEPVTNTNTNTNTTFSFATATTENTDDVTYAIKTTTNNTQVAYTPVQTDVVNKPAVSQDAANVSSKANETVVNNAKTAVETYAGNRTTEIQAKKQGGSYGNVDLLTTQAAANAITSAAAAYTGAANNIAKVEIQLQTELTSYTLADKDNAVATTALIYQVTPKAVLLNASGEQLSAETLTNIDLAAQDLTLKFQLPVPASAAAVSDRVIVTHHSNDSAYADSTSLLDVQEDEAGNHFVVIETTHFSEFELKPYVVAGTNQLISASLTLGGSIDLNFYLKLKDDVTAVRFTFNGATTTVPCTSDRYDSVKNRYKFSIPVAAKDIYKDVTIELLNANNETQAFCRTDDPNDVANEYEYTYSVYQYVDYVKDNGNTAELRDLANSLITYGYYANLHLLKEGGHTVYNTVSNSEDYTIIDYKNGRNPDGTYPIDGSGMTLLLRSETVIAYRFDDNVDYSGYKFYFTHSYSYADGGYTTERYEVDPVHTGSYWYVNSKGIPATYLDQGVTFEIYSGATKVYSTTYSPMIYGGSVLSKDTTSETLKNTIRAMYDYNRKATAYFTSLQ